MISIYDTLTRVLMPVPDEEQTVNIYCCGPTVYRDAHVGNLRTFLLADLISRALKLDGRKVNLIQNITDVGHLMEDFQGEDKLLQQAQLEKRDPFEIARKYEAGFHQDLARINILAANSYPRASETIDLMLQTISQLIASGHAYESELGSVYFDARSFPSYGAISGNKLDALKPGHRLEHSDEGDKRFHADWALWKSAGNRTEMVWDSPWGKGFPGWHIECTAMSLKFLNDRIDLHIGGIDLRFPHHENERAQSNAVSGGEAVAMWVHGEHLLFEGRKMSKSAGNVVLVQDLIDRGLDPLALRFTLLENRYRSQMDLTWAALEAANLTLRRWRSAMATWGDRSEQVADEEIVAAIAKDLDTPRVMLRLRTIEKSTSFTDAMKRAIFLYTDSLLGLDLTRSIEIRPISNEQAEFLAARAHARETKNWSESDRLRDLLATTGIAISDGPGGQSWSWI